MSDSYYVEKVLAGDVAAFGELVSKYRNRVFNLACRICGSREDAEEIAQDSFLKVYNSLGSFRNHAAFTTWLYRIVYNTSVSYLRTKKTHMVSLDDIPDTGAEFADYNGSGESEDEEHLRAIVNFALQKLSEEDRGLISLFYYEDMDIGDISEVTGISKSNVKVKLFRARKKMLEIIEVAEKNKFEYHEGVRGTF